MKSIYSFLSVYILSLTLLTAFNSPVIGVYKTIISNIVKTSYTHNVHINNNNKKPLLIGISGPSSSGKTTFASALLDRIGSENIAIINHDSYYKDFSNYHYNDKIKLNFDHPDSLDTYLLINDINNLLQYKSIKVPLYNYTTYSRLKNEYIEINPRKIIIIDGILIYENKDLCDLFDLKIYLDVDEDIILQRRILRDTVERGRSKESVLYQYSTQVYPMYEKYVKPCKNIADIVINSNNTINIDIIESYLKSYLNNN